LNYKRYSPLVNDKFERSFGFLALQDRVFALFGLMLGLVGLLYSFIGKDLKYYFSEQPDKIISFLISFFGFSMFIISFLRRRGQN
jgi:putative Mn2+ efflux pump MntP